MSHREHKEFTSTVFRQICDDARANLPSLEQYTAWEAKAEVALEHLKNKVVEYCGVDKGLGLENVKGFPRYVQLISEITDIVDFDLIHHHAGFRFFRKAPIVMQYVLDVAGDKP